MNLVEIRQKAKALRKQLKQLPMPELLRDKALMAYSSIITSKIEAAIDIKALKQCLSFNWSLVNGTTLSPTAIPHAPITQLLCDIAAGVADEMNKESPDINISAIELLMPTIASSIRPNHHDQPYPNLPDMPLIEVLKTHVLGREGKFLLPIKLLLELTISADITPLRGPVEEPPKVGVLS